MTKIVIEMAPITLLDGKTEVDLMAASDVFQKGFVNGLKGFIRREMVHVKDNDYMDIIHWESKEDAEAVLGLIEGSAECAAFFSLMDMSGMDESGGVKHYTSLASYS
ncbi:MAG: hypothetical protein JKY57_03790 [Kordiimonadaceae bacterium]|nr:hypothetical protein [Kordiimonadaceae bacterium]